MCFTPYISLFTFTIEFLLALYFLLKNPKDKLNRLIALISFMLGFYQLNEFLICATSLTIFTRLAMITTAILPAIAVSFALTMWRKKLKYYWSLLIYSPAVFFMVMFSVVHSFSESTVCNSIFIQYPYLGLFGRFYVLYYSLYIIGSAVLFYFGAQSAKTKEQKGLFHLGMLSMFIFTVPAGIFLVFLPMFYIQFASVLCEFALLVAIEFVVMLWYKDKFKLKY